MPVVSEDPKPYYPAIYCTSEEGSWSDTSTTSPYQERIFKAHCPERNYIEEGPSKVFIITYLPALGAPSEPTNLA